MILKSIVLILVKVFYKILNIVFVLNNVVNLADASTDEFPNQAKSPISSETIDYYVKYTDTDRSTIEDGLSDKGKYYNSKF